MWRIGLLAAALSIVRAAPIDAGQLGALISPGPLARAHAALEGGSKCQQCHEAGRKVTPARCLTCHTPIADRIAARKGVHRNAGGCVTCHVEHAGADANSVISTPSRSTTPRRQDSRSTRRSLARSATRPTP